MFITTASNDIVLRKEFLLHNISTVLDLWTWEEDQMLLTQDIRKVTSIKGRKAVCERVEFLGNGSLHQQKS